MEQDTKKTIINFIFYIFKLISIIGSIVILIIAFIKIIIILPSIDFLTILPWIKAIIITFSFVFSIGFAICLSFYLSEFLSIHFFIKTVKRKLKELEMYKIEFEKQREEIEKFNLFKKNLKSILEKMQEDTINIAKFVTNKIDVIDEKLYLYDRKFREFRTFVLRQLKSFATELLTLFQFVATFAVYDFTDDTQIEKEAATVFSFLIFFISWSFNIPKVR